MKTLSVLLCLVFWILGMGCVPESAKESEAPGTSVQTCQTASGAYVITCEFLSYPPPKNEHCSMHLSIQQRDGTPARSDLEVEVDADMPTHGHGINTQPEIERTPDGEYEVHGLLFHMGGLWEVYIDCVEDGIPDRATLSFTL